MPKPSLTGRPTGKVLTCKYDWKIERYRVSVLFGRGTVRQGVANNRMRIGEIVPLAGDGVGK